jgi:hypothetical protein
LVRPSPGWRGQRASPAPAGSASGAAGSWHRGWRGRSARAARIREDEDALGAAHEGVGIGQRLVGGARFKPLAAIRQSHQSARAAGDLGHGIGAEAGDDRIERGTIGGSAPSSSSVSALRPLRHAPDCPPHRPSGASAHCRPRPSSFPWRGREGIVEIVRHDLAGRKVELDLGAILGEIGRRRSSKASAVETSWMTTLWSVASASSMAGSSEGSFIDSSWPKKRCFELSKRERAADSACPLRVLPSADR